MDAYSISVTSLARRNTSRIYRDLTTVRLSSMVRLEGDKADRAPHLRTDAANTSEGGHEKPHIGIVGAGLAGLRCADVLLQHGFRVTIVEGRNRLGGRLHQEKLPNGFLVDVGPNWIHGTKDNPIMDLAKATGTTLGSWDSGSYVFGEDGVLFSTQDGTHLSTVMWSIIEDAFAYSNKNCADISPSKSLFDFFRERVVEKIPDTTADAEKKRQIVLRMSELWGAFVGSPITRQSLKFFWLEECIDGENLLCAGTYQKMLKEIAKPAVAGADIKYETKICKIRGKGASQADKVVLGTSGGLEFPFDEVVVTTPLGWLQKNLDAFDPPLPVELCKSIRNIGYGCLEKVYISFAEAFWLKPGPDGRTVEGFCQWLAPNYATATNPARWTHEIVELGSLASPLGHPTLLFYIHSDESEYITTQVRNLSSAGDRSAADEFLQSFFEPYYSRLPGYDVNDPACRPAGILSTDWLHDELAGNGSYSNYQIGLEAGDADVLAMRAGVPAMGVWLAGEHTAPFVALGTATGAYWAGEHAARGVAEKYGL